MLTDTSLRNLKPKSRFIRFLTAMACTWWSTAEIRLTFHQLETIASCPAIRLALRLMLLTMVRKSE